MTRQMPARRRQPARRPSNYNPHYELSYDGEIPPIMGNQIDARYLTLPSIAIIAIVMAGIWTTYTVLQERNRIDNRINATIEAVREVASAVKSLGENFPNVIATVSADRFTRTQHDMWCAKLEIENQKLGLKCPPVPVPPTAYVPTGTGGIPRTGYIIPNFGDRVTEGLSRAAQ